ncbi:MAG: hypothetical protein JO273_19210 [Methylobacteriaceae bacterium]|nr:hypothetical protein [Methylobacteriaceae bacterium]
MKPSLLVAAICLGTTGALAQVATDPAPAPAPPPQAAAPAPAATPEVVVPALDSPDRAAILEAARPPAEAVFGKPIEVIDRALRISGDWAYLAFRPARARADFIKYRDWARAVRLKGCDQQPDTATMEELLHKVNGRWVPDLVSPPCSGVSVTSDEVLKQRGLPPQLVGRGK